MSCLFATPYHYPDHCHPYTFFLRQHLAITHHSCVMYCTYNILCLFRINFCHTYLISCVCFVTFQSNPHDDYTKLRANQKNKRVRSESSDYSASTDCKSELGPIPRTKSRGEHISLQSKWNGIGCHPVVLSNSLSLALIVPTLQFTAM